MDTLCLFALRTEHNHTEIHNQGTYNCRRMTDEEILNEFLKEIDCEEEAPEFKKFASETVAFKRWRLTRDWSNVKEDLINEVVKKMGLA